MPKAFKHTGVLMMLAVVALGLVGAGYALWYEELTLNATVKTGTFNADWSLHNVAGVTPASTAVPVVCLGEPTSPPATLGENCDQVSEYLTAAQARTGLFEQELNRFAAKFPACTAAIGTQGTIGVTDNANDVPDNNLLTLTLSNAYPYAGCRFAVDITNSGTVPMHFAFESLTTNSAFIGIATATGTGSSTTVPPRQVDAMCAALGQSLTGTPYPDILAGPSFPNYVQLHSGEQIDCDLVLYLKEYGPNGTIAPENAGGTNGPAALTFSWEMIAHQWNEGVTTVNHPAAFEAPGAE